MASKKSAPAAPSAAVVLEAVKPNHVRLFKGATRVATIKGGVPARAFVLMLVAVAVPAMFNVRLLVLVLILYPIMAVVSRNDDRAFWILELWFKTKFRAPNAKFWGAVSFSPTAYYRRRAWLRRKG